MDCAVAMRGWRQDLTDKDTWFCPSCNEGGHLSKADSDSLVFAATGKTADEILTENKPKAIALLEEDFLKICNGMIEIGESLKSPELVGFGRYGITMWNISKKDF